MRDQGFEVRVKPRSHLDQISIDREGGVIVGVRAAPVDGRANAAVLHLLAHALMVRRTDLHIVAGQSSRVKRIAIAGMDAAEALERLRRHARAQHQDPDRL